MIDRKDVPVLMSNMDKDSELSQFFNEYWKFVKEFLNGKEEQREKEYWDELVSRSQEMSEKYNVIMDGRDIGTVVLKDSKFKFFLTATPEERARRRFTELVNRGIDVNYDKLLEDIIKRDYIDSHREVDPLKKADDAIEIDSSNYNINEVTEIICNFIENVLQ